MQETINYVKLSQKDYSMSLKLQIVREVERGEISIRADQRKYGIQGRATITTWLRKFGDFDLGNQALTKMPNTSEQRIMELETKIKLLEKQRASLEYQANVADKKAIIFDMMINLAEK